MIKNLMNIIFFVFVALLPPIILCVGISEGSVLQIIFGGLLVVYQVILGTAWLIKKRKDKKNKQKKKIPVFRHDMEEADFWDKNSPEDYQEEFDAVPEDEEDL